MFSRPFPIIWRARIGCIISLRVTSKNRTVCVGVLIARCKSEIVLLQLADRQTVPKASCATTTAHEMPIHKWRPKIIRGVRRPRGVRQPAALPRPLPPSLPRSGPSTAREFVHRETEEGGARLRPRPPRPRWSDHQHGARSGDQDRTLTLP